MDPFYHSIRHHLVGIMTICFPTTSKTRANNKDFIQLFLKDEPGFFMIDIYISLKKGLFQTESRLPTTILQGLCQTLGG